jgi:glycine dehydrogenase subunit 1
MAKAHYLAAQLEKAGLPRVHKGEFFHEFVTACPDAGAALEKLAQNGVLGGLPVPEGILWCATELNTKDEIDKTVRLVAEVCA